jgi:hypothetical protein
MSAVYHEKLAAVNQEKCASKVQPISNENEQVQQGSPASIDGLSTASSVFCKTKNKIKQMMQKKSIL